MSQSDSKTDSSPSHNVLPRIGSTLGTIQNFGAMIYLIAILTALFGGLLGRALVRGSRCHRMLGFIVPVSISTGLLQMPLLFDMIRFGFLPLDWELLTTCYTILAAFLTGVGWLCAFCIQKIFED